MAEMPERIWACRLRVQVVCEGEWHSDPDAIASGETEFVRADLLDAKDAEIERLRATLRPLAEAFNAGDRQTDDREIGGKIADAQTRPT